MSSVQAFRISLGILCLSMQPSRALSQGTSKSAGATEREQTATSYSYSPGSGDRLESISKTSQSQRLLDERNYDLTTTFRVPSINGGETIDREVSERSQRVNDTQFQVERVIRTPDPSGRLATHEMVKEDHQLKDKTEEIHRSYYRSDINGKLAAQAVENETITKPNARETQTTRTLYRPDVEGKFSLEELEEASELRVSDTLTIKESKRKLKEASGRMPVVESLKETTTKQSDKSFKREMIVHQAGENGRLALTDKVTETQTEHPDGTREYQRLLESRNINPYMRNLNSTSLTLSQRVTGEERRHQDGSIESITRVETLDPFDQSKGLRVTEIVTEITRPLPNGKVSVERIVKIRDVNGNYTVSQKIAQTVEPGR
jgi:hypothetical protein